MPSQDHDRIWVGRTDVEQFDIVVSGCCEIAFVRRYTKAVDLRVRMLYGTVTDTGESFPESDCVVIAS